MTSIGAKGDRKIAAEDSCPSASAQPWVAAPTGLPCLRRAEAFRVGAMIPLTQRQIKCHTMPSNFTRKSLKTNDGHPNEVSHFFEGPISRTRAVFRFSASAFRFRQKKRNTVALLFQRNSLKTNDGHPNKAKHFFEGRISRFAQRASLSDSNFSTRRFLATNHSPLATFLSGGII